MPESRSWIIRSISSTISPSILSHVMSFSSILFSSMLFLFGYAVGFILFILKLNRGLVLVYWALFGGIISVAVVGLSV